MQIINLDKEWTFRRGLLDSIGIMETNPGVVVDLPHDGMIGTKVSPDAPAQADMGYFTGDLTNYTKFVYIPEEWADENVGLSFDGAMMNATVEVNGCKVGLQHYGYAPFYMDLTDVVAFGEENRITIHTNTAMQPNSRWYTGSGLFRGVQLCHGPKVHIAQDGVFIHSREVDGDIAFMEADVDVDNTTVKNKLVTVAIDITEDGSDEILQSISRTIQVNGRCVETAHMSFAIRKPKLWDADNPNLYNAHVRVTDIGEYRTRLIKDESGTTDEICTLFGIRVVTADSIRGLRINEKEVKLKGGCLHHDNGLIGAVSLYEAEARKVRKLKEVGFNAIRTTHNPPSRYLVEACDRIGMYIFDEAFDAWGIAKRGGDYNQYFDDCWERDMTAFVRRDRIHPSVIIWSTGNEIPERGGLNNGYTLATRLAETIKSLDPTRPVSNGICSMWSGLDDTLAKSQNQAQNANENADALLWEKVTEPFTNGLDIVGYNYMEDSYETDHELYPERVILGSENFPKEIGYRWPFVESLPYAIGDFTWTAWDYLGEAGIGKAVYVDADDPLVEKGPWALMPQETSPFPWRTANDADYDITGYLLPQGEYRSVVWGNNSTYVYTKHPDTFGKVEMMSMWGFPAVVPNWNYDGYEGQSVEIVVFSNAEEAEVLINGKAVGRKPVNMDKPLPFAVSFDAIYEKGKVEAISYKDGKEVSRAVLVSSGQPAGIELIPEKKVMGADGHDLIYVQINILDEDGIPVTDANVKLDACVSGAAYLAGFGTGNPITDEDYTDSETVSYRGRAMAIIRAGYEAGEVKLEVCGEGIGRAEVVLKTE